MSKNKKVTGKATCDASKPSLIRKHFFLLGAILLFGALCVFLIVRDSPLSDKKRFSAMLRLQQEYADLHSRKDVWLTVAVPTPAFYEKAADVIWKRGEEVRELLSRSQTVSRDTQSVWDNFHNFGATLQIDERDGHLISISNGSKRDMIGIKAGKEISFMPQDLAQRHTRAGNMTKLFCWRSDAGISIADIEWPRKFLVAALYHELYHGMLHPVKSNNYHHPKSIEYAIEEMEAHRIESQVINSVTGGMYMKRFEEIVAKHGPHVKDVVAGLTISDLKYFDQVLEMESSGLIPASLAISQHTLGLAVYVLEQQGRPKKEWGEFFLWTTRSGEVITSQ